MSYITPIHPGTVLQDELEELGVSQSALAAHIGVLPKTINEICNGKRGISAAMAWKLCTKYRRKSAVLDESAK
jgi:addiction module HigA family antidote